jgi:hypothetical protein
VRSGSLSDWRDIAASKAADGRLGSSRISG